MLGLGFLGLVLFIIAHWTGPWITKTFFGENSEENRRDLKEFTQEAANYVGKKIMSGKDAIKNMEDFSKAHSQTQAQAFTNVKPITNKSESLVKDIIKEQDLEKLIALSNSKLKPPTEVNAVDVQKSNQVNPNFKYCTNCGTKLESKANYCSSCGEKLI